MPTGREHGIGCFVAAEQTERFWQRLYCARGVAAEESPDPAYDQDIADCDGYCKYSAQGFECRF